MTRSDARNKEVALARIKRLCSSGLPLEPLARGLFDLISDGVPHSPNRVFHVGGVHQVSAYLGTNPEIQKLIPLQKQFFIDAGPESCGVKFPYDSYAFQVLLPSRGDVLKTVEIEVAAILARSQDRVGLRGGRRHEEDWQEQS